MVVENRRQFLRRGALIAAGVVLNTCVGEFPEDPINVQNIRLAEKIFRETNENMIPIADLGKDVSFEEDVTSFGTGRLEVHLRLSKNGMVFPSLAKGRVSAWTESLNTEALSRITVAGKYMNWQFQTYGRPLPEFNSSVSIGQPLFKLDFSTFTPKSRTNDFYAEPLMIIKGWKISEDEKTSQIGKANLIMVKGSPLEIKPKQA